MDTKHQRQVWSVLIISLLGIQVSLQSTVSKSPTPVTTSEGQEFIIRCAIDAPSEPEGVRVKKKLADGIQETTIYQSLPNDWVSKNFDTKKYGLKDVGKHDVEITVKDVKFADAGLYICEPIVVVTNRAQASAVVLGEPLLTIPKNIISGKTFQNLCEVQFMADASIAEGNAHFPRLYTQVEGGKIMEGTTVYTKGVLGTINAKLDMTSNTTLMKENDGKNYTCMARTADPAGGTSTSLVLDVKFPVTRPQVPRDGLFYVGDIIRCTAEGNPEPTMTWIAVKTKVKIGTVNQNLTIVEGMIGEVPEVWKCEAKNTIGAHPYVEVDTITFRVEKKGPVDPGESKGPGVNKAVIAAAVVVPIILILVIILVIIVVLKKRRTGSKKTPIDDETTANTMANTSHDSLDGKTGPLAPDAAYDNEPAINTNLAKPNTNGRNVRIQGEKEELMDPAATARRPVSPMPEQYQQPRYDDLPQYPDMLSAHPGLQAAITGTDKRLSSGNSPGSANPAPTYAAVNKPRPQPRTQPLPPQNPQDYTDTEV